MQELLHKAAPAFTLQDQKGDERSLQDFAGNWVVLYFYPKDDTPGCTKQACSLRDTYDDLTEAGAIVVGISKDSVDSHKSFATKHNLPFYLLSDPDAKTIHDYAAWGPKMFGKEGILRKTYIINPNGIIQKVYLRADPVGHGQKVTEDLRALKNPI